MRALYISLLAYCCVGACGGSQGTQGAADTATAPPGDAGTNDLTGGGDMAFPIGIACGMTPCAATSQFCCTTTSGTTGMCGQGDDAANCGGSRFYCDGPEDCAPVEPHCCIVNAVATCSATACPNTELCHADKDCGMQVCCSSAETPYQLCLNAGCTTS